jgi:hypothetical protein
LRREFAQADLLFREPAWLHVHPQRVTDSTHF